MNDRKGFYMVVSVTPGTAAGESIMAPMFYDREEAIKCMEELYEKDIADGFSAHYILRLVTPGGEHITIRELPEKEAPAAPDFLTMNSIMQAIGEAEKMQREREPEAPGFDMVYASLTDFLKASAKLEEAFAEWQKAYAGIRDMLNG